LALRASRFSGRPIISIPEYPRKDGRSWPLAPRSYRESYRVDRKGGARVSRSKLDVQNAKEARARRAL